MLKFYKYCISARNFLFPNSEFRNLELGSILHLDFEITSYFDILISDFEVLRVT